MLDKPRQRLADDPKSMNRTVYTYHIKTLSQYPLLIAKFYVAPSSDNFVETNGEPFFGN